VFQHHAPVRNPPFVERAERRDGHGGFGDLQQRQAGAGPFPAIFGKIGDVGAVHRLD
jgi:hypothetical protein